MLQNSTWLTDKTFSVGWVELSETARPLGLSSGRKLSIVERPIAKASSMLGYARLNPAYSLSLLSLSTMSINLSPEQELFLKNKLNSGKYQTIDEIITAAFHLLDQKETTSPSPASSDRLSWEETYQAIAQEKEDWSDFEVAIADGIEGDSFDSSKIWDLLSQS